MDELTLLRLVPEHAPALDADIESRSEAAMLAAITRAEATEMKPARRWLRPRSIGWVAGAAAVVVGTLVVANIVAGPGGASPAAADTLTQAAAAAIHNADPVVPEGEYLRIRTDSVYANYNTASSGKFIAFLTRGQDSVYIPSDTSDTWVWQRGPRVPFRYFGAQARVFADRSDPNEFAGTEQAKNGAFGGTPSQYTAATFDKLPTQPRALLDAIYAADGDRGQSRDGQALSTIADMLRTGQADARIRANLYRAVALIPGVTVIDKQANLDGRTGVALGRIEQSTGIRQDIIIDPNTGLVIGERQITTHPVSGLPANTVNESTSVTTDVVPTAP